MCVLAWSLVDDSLAAVTVPHTKVLAVVEDSALGSTYSSLADCKYSISFDVSSLS